MACLRASAPNGTSVEVLDRDVAKWILEKMVGDPKSNPAYCGPLQPGNISKVLTYLDEMVSHANGLNVGDDEGCFGAIMDHFAAKDDSGNFVANKELDIGKNLYLRIILYW